MYAVMFKYSLIDDNTMYVFEKATEESLNPILKKYISKFIIRLKLNDNIESAIYELDEAVHMESFRQFTIGVLNTIESSGSIRNLLARLEYESFKTTQTSEQMVKSLKNDSLIMILAGIISTSISIYNVINFTMLEYKIVLVINLITMLLISYYAFLSKKVIL
jgi:hypothetical protein